MSGSFLADALGSAVGGLAVELITAPGTFVAATVVIVLCGLVVLLPRKRNQQVRTG